MTPTESKKAQYEKENRDAAEIILRDPEKHGGEQSLPVQWARLVMERAKHDKEGLVNGTHYR